ncbi:MAG: molybdenum cofactor guanylyltransferase [candidate division Zixibacteria bacterium]|nr:molybdenum cofactor guanylyltransferase [candidate division Zixibacteria bacterium]
MFRENLDAYILAGGRSRRMGTDKLYLQIDGQTLLERTIATCRACLKKVKLVAGNSARLSSLSVELVLDSPMAKGPMAGIIAALEDCETETCFITAVDLPDLNPDVVESIIDRYEGQQYFGLLEANGLQPLCGIYHKSALEVFYQFARNKGFSVTEVVKTLNYDVINVDSPRWRNLNYPEDLAVGEFDG